MVVSYNYSEASGNPYNHLLFWDQITATPCGGNVSKDQLYKLHKSPIEIIYYVSHTDSISSSIMRLN